MFRVKDYKRRCPFTDYFPDDNPLSDMGSRLRKYLVCKFAESYISAVLPPNYMNGIVGFLFFLPQKHSYVKLLMQEFFSHFTFDTACPCTKRMMKTQRP